MYENPEVLFGGEKRLLELVSLIYDAVEQPSLWPQVLDGIADAANSRCTLLFAKYAPRTGDISASARGDPEYIQSYIDYYGSVNVLAPPCDRIFPEGSVRYSHIALPDKEFEKTEFYADWFRPQDYLYSFGIKIPLPGMKPAYLTSLRAKRYGAYCEREGAVLTTLSPHLQRALRLHIQISMLRSGLAATLDHLPYGLALLNARGKCVLANKRAQEILNRKDGLMLSDSRLCAVSPRESFRFREIIARAIGHNINKTWVGGAMLVSRSRGTPLHVVVSPFTAGLTEIPPQVVATVYIRDMDAEQRSPILIVQSLYGLTKAEANLAALLAEGRNISEAAEVNRVTRETVRSQLKSIFQKTGVRRQADLMRLLAGL